jgi:hypothetical protein
MESSLAVEIARAQNETKESDRSDDQKGKDLDDNPKED